MTTKATTTTTARSNKKTYWFAEKEACLRHAHEVYIEEGEIAQTVRHYYYKLLGKSIKLLPNENSGKNAYNFVSRLLSDARIDGIFPWEAVIDPGRRNFSPASYTSLAQFVRASSQSQFVADVWRGQANRIEVWVEKDGLFEFAKSICEQYRVPVYVNKGFASVTVIEEAAKRYGTGEGWTILYCGDFDPSGLEIQSVLLDSLSSHQSRPTIVRVGLTYEDTFSLSAEAGVDLKKGDSRTKKFQQDYPNTKGYEIEALTVTELRQRIIKAIERYVDVDALNAAIDLEDRIDAFVNPLLYRAMLDVHSTIITNGIPDAQLAKHEQLRYLLPLNNREDSAS